MCILLKSPVRSWTVTSVTRPTSLSGASVGGWPRACLLNISGARRLYHTFAFHLSLILRAAARDFFSAMETARRGVAYLRVQQGRGGTLDLTDSTASSLAPVRGDAGSRRWRATRPAPIALVSRSLGRDGRSLQTESSGCRLRPSRPKLLDT